MSRATTIKSKADRVRRLDNIFHGLTFVGGLIALIIIIGILIELWLGSSLSIKKFGIKFLFSQEWNPVTQEFGALSSIYGTLVSTLIALVLGIPLSFAIALFLVELAPPWLRCPVGYAIELLAAIPSIIYGMWGLFILSPIMAKYVQPLLKQYLGFLPLFEGPPMGVGMLTAGMILALMILPFMSAVMRDVFQMVPTVIKESAYGMGAFTWEVTSKITVRYGLRGLVGAVFLGLGRAIGETMAVTFVIGNKHKISPSLLEAGNSIASTLANEFSEASEPLYLSSLIQLGLILLLITLTIQIIAHLWLHSIRKSIGGGA